MPALRLITPASALPVSLADAKAQLKVAHDAEDALITLMIKAAARVAEQQLNRALMAQTWELIVDAFPAAELRLERPRVLTVDAVTYVDATGAEQTLSADAYTLDADLTPGWLLPALNTTWPATREQANAVRVRFTSGYGSTAADVPEDVRVWLLMHVAAAYRHREAFTAGISVVEHPARFHAGLLDAERLYW